MAAGAGARGRRDPPSASQGARGVGSPGSCLQRPLAPPAQKVRRRRRRDAPTPLLPQRPRSSYPGAGRPRPLPPPLSRLAWRARSVARPQRFPQPDGGGETGSVGWGQGAPGTTSRTEELWVPRRLVALLARVPPPTSPHPQESPAPCPTQILHASGLCGLQAALDLWEAALPKAPHTHRKPRMERAGMGVLSVQPPPG